MNEIERYAGLTTADKGALLDAKANGFKVFCETSNGKRVFYSKYPSASEANSRIVSIDLALAQIAEMESAEKPMTVDQWLNQATPEQKAEFVVRMSNAYVDSESGRKSDLVCVDSLQRGARTWLCDYPNCEQCFATFFNSPYTEGETE